MDAEEIVSITMTRSAALRLHRALIRGAVALDGLDKEDDALWLEWCMARLAIASPASLDGAHEGGRT